MGRGLKMQPPLGIPKISTIIRYLKWLARYEPFCVWQLLHMCNLHSIFIQPMGRDLKYNPLYKTQKLQPFFAIFNGLRDKSNFVTKSYCACAPLTLFLSSQWVETLKYNSFRKPTTFNHFCYLYRFPRYERF